MAIAEVLHAPTSTDDNLIYIGFYEGIKASIFLNGELYRGPFGNAGIIGRNQLNRDGKTLEHLASIPAVTKHFEAKVSQLDEVAQASYQPILEQSNARQQFQAIIEHAETGDVLCQAVIQPMMDLLALSVGNLLHILQPSVLIIGGALTTLSDTSFNHLETTIRQHLPALLSNQLIIQQAQLASPNSVPIGVAHHFLRRYITTDNFLAMNMTELSPL